VLRDRGWRIHRVWSTDWFHRPDEQLRKILAAIDAAILDVDREEADLASEPELTIEINAEPAQVERTEPIHPMEGEAGAEWVTPYQEAAFNVPRETAIHDTRQPILREIAARIVEIEGPIHREEVARRVTSLWGLSRTGSRIVETINQAIDASLHIKTLRADGPFLMHARQEAKPQVRSRSGVGSLSLKKPEMIAPAEITHAITLLVNDNLGLRRDDLPTMIARLFGFKATSAKFKEVVEDALPRAQNENLVILRDEKLYPPRSIAGSVA
jgi:hypothetical protein